MQGRRPVVVGVATWCLAFLVLAALIVGTGLLLTHVLLPDGVGRFDDTVSRWFVQQRTSTLDGVTLVGSDLGSTPGILGVATLVVLVLAVGRHWRQIGLVIATLSLEFGVFLVTTLAVERHRPSVPRLDATPATSSFPSGHTAAALALYVSIALVIASLVRSAVIRGVAWMLAVAIPVFVGLSRLYRGMHHLTDVFGSVVLGVGAVAFGLLAVRAAVASEADTAEPYEGLDTEPAVEVAS